MIVLEGEDNLRDPGHIESDTVRHLKETYTEKHGEEFLKNKGSTLNKAADQC